MILCKTNIIINKNTLIKLGLSVTDLASSIASRISSYPELPFFTQITCHPNPSNLLSTFSVKAISVSPSIEI
ncbi:hypothetical protein HanPSC8_Chr08g0325751 [Helianthus annuus]|nr:hypothetical protein HanPSC8_Chr08g0325751 [Helianthus annuus]